MESHNLEMGISSSDIHGTKEKPCDLPDGLEEDLCSLDRKLCDKLVVQTSRSRQKQRRIQAWACEARLWYQNL